MCSLMSHREAQAEMLRRAHWVHQMPETEPHMPLFRAEADGQTEKETTYRQWPNQS